ncbi:PadR family transcriptional regulator [Metabacillus sp. GX 13764]|uniref:PadR family transcriptional regulator n=1 Tax=Metabacillus kandeliae TaxID=2900151 RepID=UPI001E346DFE|nr:PadR family transcriptional regulator [Metabacillus kandeliae]MCD7035885.1 PadR family transcriptional regulator [Metabacillus kandeliae]
MSVKLVILGLLLEGDKHPYEVQQIIHDRQMQHYIKLASGSLYYAFETLEQKQFVKVVDVIRDNSRPERTVYSITDSGRREFEKLYFQQLMKKEHMERPIFAVLSFAGYIDQEKLSQALLRKKEDTAAYLDKMKKLYKFLKPDKSVANLAVVMRVILHLKTELLWLDRLQQAAENGELTKNNTEYFTQVEEFLDLM